ncbi:DUF2147 domain-containing protein [Paracoccus sp. (in: a-proteobacteria)]|uniref:DUF2147 domain-containing protein n=1 Tax=Paracoccus sp. TaxID=267 RepID=UPI00289D5C18|nr:DUF2147 domain-containing protein [Paracoccus sp. (in: a-proteobacteria)]
MKTLIWAGAISMLAMTAQAEGISGIFQTQPNDQGHIGMVEFYPCGAAYCGKLIRSFDTQGKEITSPHQGKNIVANMKDNGDDTFSGGTIWDPGSGKTYKSKMTLSGKTLNVSGCVAVFCRTQSWTRVK